MRASAPHASLVALCGFALWAVLTAASCGSDTPRHVAPAEAAADASIPSTPAPLGTVDTATTQEMSSAPPVEASLPSPPPPKLTTTPAPAIHTTSLPVTTSPSRVVSRGRTDRKSVTLTFDAGADRGHAERILDELARQHVRAAFGMTGKWAETNSDLLGRMQREGHELINHSYDHSSFTGVSWSSVARTPAERASQLARTERIIQDVTGTSSRPYFRPPFGDYDTSVLADVGAQGYGITVMWTVDSMGWRGWSAGQISQRCLDGAASGAIYIFHVGEASQDADALPTVIDGLRARGFDIVSLADLLEVPST